MRVSVNGMRMAPNAKCGSSLSLEHVLTYHVTPSPAHAIKSTSADDLTCQFHSFRPPYAVWLSAGFLHCSTARHMPFSFSRHSPPLLSLHILPAGRELISSVILPLRSPQFYTRLGISPPRGVLLHGPSGCGKTSLARALVRELRANFVEIHAPQLLGSVIGESEARLAAIFTAARRAAPCVLFIDQVGDLPPLSLFNLSGEPPPDPPYRCSDPYPNPNLRDAPRALLVQIDTLAPPRGDDQSAEGTLDRLLSLLLVELDGVQV